MAITMTIDDRQEQLIRLGEMYAASVRLEKAAEKALLKARKMTMGIADKIARIGGVVLDARQQA